MTENPTPFSLDSGLSAFNNIFEIPKGQREIALKTMEATAQTILFGANDLYRARQNGQSLLIENTYGDAADHFAKAIDGSWKGFYEKGQEGNSEATRRIRSVFYSIIRFYSSEQVLKGTAEIRKLGIVK